MSEHDRNLARLDEGDTERHRVAQSLFQEAIDDVGRTAQGREVAEVRARLVEALAARGIGEQPPRWLDTVASGLTAGHRYVEDARDA
jgi:hypothetical protein